MARLAIMRFDDIEIPELASKKAVPELSQTRITMAVRETLGFITGSKMCKCTTPQLCKRKCGEAGVG
jgi:hypothetical protein